MQAFKRASRSGEHPWCLWPPSLCSLLTGKTLFPDLCNEAKQVPWVAPRIASRPRRLCRLARNPDERHVVDGGAADDGLAVPVGRYRAVHGACGGGLGPYTSAFVFLQKAQGGSQQHANVKKWHSVMKTVRAREYKYFGSNAQTFVLPKLLKVHRKQPSEYYLVISIL